ncbi:MAG TPA: DNA mismatch repair endonuclease MutL [Candidatus Tripitaka sp. YC43]
MKKDETGMDKKEIATPHSLPPIPYPGRIRLLEDTVAGKIAAGEVIERPASVVKELVENSIDASASRIDVELIEGGRGLIKVIDNGVGMRPEDLSMLFLKHATSKISGLEDLEAINTLGFRGEALASIGVVSHTRVLSCARGETTGAELEVRGGKRGEVKYLGAPGGTQVEVRELFYNVPARRKFLKATPSEMASISEVLTRLALSHPEVHFTLTHNQREVFNLPPASTIKERIAAFFGQDFAKELLPINSREPTLEVSGYIKPPAQNHGNARMQYIFLNGRHIREGNVSHAIYEAYRNLLPPGRYPIVFLFLKSEPGLVDVNVHPTKLEVRFREPAKVHGQVLQSLKKVLTQYTPQILPTPREEAHAPTSSADAKGLPGEVTPSLAQVVQSPVGARCNVPLQQTFPSGPFVQLHRTYIVEETPKGLNIVDQHALHEILLYTELRHKILEGSLPVQRLLIPELVELNSSSFFNLMGLLESLSKAGVEIEEFGKNTVIVRSLPQVLKDLDIKEFITDLMERTLEGGGASPAEEGGQVLDNVLKAMACKGAIKSGQKLNPQEMQALLEKRDSSSSSARCPHGRPTTLFLSLEELDKHFRRKTARE